METKEKDKYDMLKHEKKMLHAKYITGISAGIAVLAIVASCSWNKDFVNQVSFAGTISSIILSVIAIIMTITGESKTDNAQNKLEDVSDNLENITSNINGSVAKLNKTAETFDNNMKNIEDDILSKVNSRFEKTENKLDSIFSKDDSKNSNNMDNKDYLGFFESFMMHIKDNYKEYVYISLYWFFTKKKKIDLMDYINDIQKLNINLSEENKIYMWSISTVYYSGNQPKLKDYIIDIMEKNYKEYKEKIDTIAKAEESK